MAFILRAEGEGAVGSETLPIAGTARVVTIAARSSCRIWQWKVFQGTLGTEGHHTAQ